MSYNNKKKGRGKTTNSSSSKKIDPNQPLIKHLFIPQKGTSSNGEESVTFQDDAGGKVE